jgi:chemotaxis protein MotB
MRTRRHLLSDHDGLRDIWPAFTDVMSTLALILFVLVLLAYVRSLVSSKRMDAFQHQIAASEARLRTLEGDLRRTAAEVASERAMLATSEQKLHDQAGVIEENDRELDDLRSQLQGIAVLRVAVLNKLKQAIETQLRPTHPGAGDLVLIGDNGNIVINESLVFELNSYAIKPEAKPLLDALAVALGNVLDDASIRENVDTIVIQGHTDERGADPLNWDLSAKRANAVIAYLFDANKVLATSYGRYFAASAYSKFRPLDPARTEAAYQRNRRIEISVVPKDSNVRKVIDDYVHNIKPMAPVPGTPPSQAAPGAPQ